MLHATISKQLGHFVFLQVCAFDDLNNSSLLLLNCDLLYFSFRCAIVNPYGALLSAVVPASLCVLTVIIIIIHLHQKEEEWKKYDDIFYGRLNSKGKNNFFTAVSWKGGSYSTKFCRLGRLHCFHPAHGNPLQLCMEHCYVWIISWDCKLQGDQSRHSYFFTSSASNQKKWA